MVVVVWGMEEVEAEMVVVVGGRMEEVETGSVAMQGAVAVD